MKTLEEMRELHAQGKLSVLTALAADELKGQKITTIYFGYRGQDNVNTFIVGDVVAEIEYYRNLKEDCYPNEQGHQNRAEYWESYMSPSRLRERQRPILLTSEGKMTYHYLCDGVFCCSDDDRWVFYIVEE